MIVVKPQVIDDATLDSSTIAEPDVSAGEVEWAAGTYTTGERRIKSSTHRIYEVTADPSTTDDPEIGVTKTPPTWVDVSPTNKWAMFDTVNSTQSDGGNQLIIELTNGLITNSVAGFNVTGATSINITVDDPVDGIVYDEDVSMQDYSNITDWYNYYFSDIIAINQFAKFDLPAYPAGTVIITVDGADIKFGNLVVGSRIDLGAANYGTSVQLLDFSRKETDSFGNTVVTQGRTSKLVDYDVTILKTRVNYVFSTIASMTTVPTVWVGDDGNDDPTLVFGYYRDYRNNISSPTITDATIQIEGLV